MLGNHQPAALHRQRTRELLAAENAAAGERALAVAQDAVELQGLFLAHPLSARLADLMVYLRQPAPDAQRLKVARAVADGDLDAAL